MSREFGDHNGGFFHDKVRGAAEDASAGRHEVTRAWGKVLEAMQDVTYAIASDEAGDSGPDFPIRESFNAVRGVKAALAGVEAAISTHRSVARDEVKDVLRALLPEPWQEDGRILIDVPKATTNKALDGHFYDRFSEALREHVNEWAHRNKVAGTWVSGGSSGSSTSSTWKHCFVLASDGWQKGEAIRAALVAGDVAAAIRIIDGTT